MAIPEQIKIEEPWQAIDPSRGNGSRFVAELVRELVPGHVLFGLTAEPVAFRIDQDDVLFEVAGDSFVLAVVHLTYCKEGAPCWPRTTLFTSWDEWLKKEMQPSHDEYVLGSADFGPL